MSWLFLDTTMPREFRYGLVSSGKMRVTHVSSRAHALLPRIARSYGMTQLRQIDGICIVQGPGSFSSVRGGVLVANILARVLQKPLVGVDCAEAMQIDVLVARLERGALPSSSYVMPVYDAEPNITLPSRTP